jgi:uncharacterized phage protein gp47/JayE
MALVASIDAYGIHSPTYPEILADLQASYRAIFGTDLYLEADSQEGQMLAVFAMALYDANQLAVSVYNSFSPATAQREGLSRVVLVNGIARRTASHSTVDLTLTGQAGTVITGGVAQDVAGQKWDLPASVTIPLAGEVTVTATAQDAGAVQAASGEVSAIATPTRGWQAVTNALAATPGTDVETDAALRQRQRLSTALPSQTVLDGIEGALASLTGVTRCRCYENDEDAPDARGIPAHSVAVVVEGGDTDTIAQALARKKTLGAGTHGSTSVTVAGSSGQPVTVRFFRPTLVSPTVEVVIAPRAGYVSTTGAAIQANVAAHLAALPIGEDVLLSKLYTPVNAAEPMEGKRTFDVRALGIARPGDGLAAVNLPLAYTEAAVGAAANVTVTVES